MQRDPEVLELVSRLVENRGFQFLREEAMKRRERIFTNNVRVLMETRSPVDALSFEFDRGFWKGVEYAFEKLPQEIIDEFRRFLENAVEEVEE